MILADGVFFLRFFTGQTPDMPGEPYKISGKEGKTMKEYEKPLMNVILLNGDVVTASPCGDDYQCGTETPPICIMADD